MQVGRIGNYRGLVAPIKQRPNGMLQARRISKYSDSSSRISIRAIRDLARVIVREPPKRALNSINLSFVCALHDR